MTELKAKLLYTESVVISHLLFDGRIQHKMFADIRWWHILHGCIKT